MISFAWPDLMLWLHGFYFVRWSQRHNLSSNLHKLKGLVDKSRGIVTRIAEAFANIKPKEPLRLARQAARIKRNWSDSSSNSQAKALASRLACKKSRRKASSLISSFLDARCRRHFPSTIYDARYLGSTPKERQDELFDNFFSENNSFARPLSRTKRKFIHNVLCNNPLPHGSQITSFARPGWD